LIWHECDKPFVRLGGIWHQRRIMVHNPWSGFRSPSRLNGLPLVPHDCAWVFYLALRTQGIVPGRVGVTEISWIGNHYRPIGLGAAASTQRCWNRMRRWFDRRARERFRGIM
jgi:hypothetical protein